MVLGVFLVGTIMIPSAFAVQDRGDFRLVYVPTDKYTDYEKWIKSWNHFESHVDWLNQNFKLPNNITILINECGVSNAWYNPADLQIVFCYELIEEFNLYYNDRYSGKVSVERIDQAVMSTVNFVFFHEIGHVLIDIHNIPATGSQEDAVDQFSTYVLMEFSDDPDAGTQTVIDATDFWLYRHQAYGLQPSMFADTHSLNIQRFYDLNCYVYGSNTSISYIVEEGYLPIERAQNCPYEYSKIVSSWNLLLDSIMVNSPSQLSLIATPSLNPDSDIFIKTDQDEYSKGDVITISGSMKHHDPSVQNIITFVIKNQAGDSLIRLQTEPEDVANYDWLTPASHVACWRAADCAKHAIGQFSTTLPVLGQLSKAGEYYIMATWTPVFDVYGVYVYNAKQQSITTFEIVSASAATSEQQTPQEYGPQPNSGGCLIATAAFGSEMAPQVQFLRELRDNTVLQTESGSAFMAGFNQFYYSFSPTIADYERENPAFKETVKLALTPLLTSLTLLQYADIDSESEMLGYGIGIILLNIGMYFVAPAILIMKVRKRI